MMIGVAQVIGMKPTLRSFFSIGAALRENLGRGLEREELRDRGERGRGADRLAGMRGGGVVRKHRPHDCRGDDALIAFVLALDRRALQLPRAARARPGCDVPAGASRTVRAGGRDQRDCRRWTWRRAPIVAPRTASSAVEGICNGRVKAK